MQRVSVCLVIALVVAPWAWPQASSSTVRGTVRDQGQAVVPRTKVTLTNTATTVERSTLTNEAGVFVFPGMFPGPYNLTAESPGMKKYEASLTLQAQQDAAIDVAMEVGQTLTQVEVRDVTPLVVSDNATLGQQKLS